MKREITENLYNMALARIEELLPMVTEETPTDDVKSVELCLMSDIVEEYEKTYFPIAKPDFKEVIKMRLEEENMHKKTLAERIGVSPSRVSEYLSGKSEPTLKIASAICRTLNIKAEIALSL